MILFFLRITSPLAALNLALSGTQVAAAKTKASAGRAEMARRSLHPPHGMTAAASNTSRHAPRAQKQSSRTTHLPCYQRK